jgi:hypothetical protein
LDVKVGRTKEVQKSRASTPAREEVLPVHPTKESQQREITMPKKDKNNNGKRNTETKLTGKKARKLSKKRENIKKLQKVREGTSLKENLQNWNFVEISEQCHMAPCHEEAIYLLGTI